MFFSPIQRIDLCHFRVGQREIIEFSILPDVIRVAGAGNDYHALLKIPAEDYLRGGHAVNLGDIGDHLVPQQFRRMPPASQGIPALDHDAQILNIGDYLILLIVGVDLILHQRRGNGHLGQKFLKFLHIPVGEAHSDVHIHITSGHEVVVDERLDQGLVDFGVFMEPTDLQKYDFIRLPAADTWGLLMRKDHPLAEKAAIRPKDLIGVPLICSNQNLFQNQLAGWARSAQDKMDIIATYNLLFNASLMVEEGLGCAICLDGIIPTTQDRPLRFRPLEPQMEAGISVAWKKHQVLSKACQLFLDRLQRGIAETGEN